MTRTITAVAVVWAATHLLSPPMADAETMRSALDGVPADLVCSVTGLVRVADYLDAMRGKS